MALTNCKECGREISKKADKCIHCGVKLKSGGSGFLWAFLIIALFFVGYSFFTPSLSSASSDTSISHPNNFLAYNYAEDAVKKKLKSPSSAKFPESIEKSKHINYVGEGEYQINSWVDSQNSFGTMIRSNFSVVIVFDSNSVSFKKLKLE